MAVENLKANLHYTLALLDALTLVILMMQSHSRVPSFLICRCKVNMAGGMESDCTCIGEFPSLVLGTATLYHNFLTVDLQAPEYLDWQDC